MIYDGYGTQRQEQRQLLKMDSSLPTNEAR